MINAFIARILKQPGRYAISSFLMMTKGAYYCIEVDAQGKVWQLDPAGERDGELRPELWIGDEIVLDPRAIDDVALRATEQKG